MEIGFPTPDKFTIFFFACFSLCFHFILAVGFKHQEVIALPTRPNKYKNLQMRAGAPFKIAIFSDLHFGENAWTDWGPRQDVNSVKVMNTVLDDENPACIGIRQSLQQNPGVFHGPVCLETMTTHCLNGQWNGFQPLEFLNLFAQKRTQHIQASASQCWPIHADNYKEYGAEACSFRGTHRLELMKHEIDHNALSYSKNGPKELWPSVSNYVLQVSSSDGPMSPVVYLYFLDSGGGSYPEVISSAQADWFRHKSEEINPDSRVPELIFWHIPSQAYKKVAPRFGIHQPCVGLINKEGVAAQEAELGIMKLLTKRPSVKAIFVGHNHGLDWCCPNQKLWLCFARHTGYGGYGDWARGARILEISQKPFSVKSWIRMEDHVVHSRIVLSP